MYCAKCGETIQPDASFCQKCGAETSSSDSIGISGEDVLGSATPRKPVSPEVTIEKKPPTKWLIYLLYASIIVDFVAIVSGLLQFHLLSQFQAGTYSSRAALIAAATDNDNRQRVVGLLQVAAYIVTVVLFAVWIYRANKTARRLGAEGMEFTPGWAVGYYFIPFVNLWIPYGAMKEIWLASKSPASWKSVKRGSILPWWWALWLITNFVGYIVFRLSLNAESMSELLGLSSVQIASDVIDIIAIILAIVLVKQISSMQHTHIGQSTNI